MVPDVQEKKKRSSVSRGKAPRHESDDLAGLSGDRDFIIAFSGDLSLVEI